MLVNNRKIRVLNQTKARKVVNGAGYPSRRSGRDNDIQVRVTKDGVILCVKNSGKWYFTIMQPINN